jgi:hypothetical protein
MISSKYPAILIVDIESDSPYPDSCEIVQLSSIAIDSQSLEIIKESEFDISVCPEDINKTDYISLHESTLNFHAKNNNCSIDHLISEWKKGVSPKVAIDSFSQYHSKYQTKKNTMYGAPIFGGANPSFDIEILERYWQKYGINYKNMFKWRDTMCVIHQSYLWLSSLDDSPPNYKMDTLREYFGISGENAHNSLKDVRDEAELLIRFLRLYRRMAPKVRFRNALATNKE